MEKTTKKDFVLSLDKIDRGLRSDVDALMKARMLYVSDLGDQPSDDEVNYLATLTDLASQLRTAVILCARLEYFKTKIQ